MSFKDIQRDILRELLRPPQKLPDQGGSQGTPSGTPPGKEVPQILPQAPPRVQGPIVDQLNQLLQEGEPPLPASPAEIPDFLYKRGTKSFDVTYTRIFQGATDPKEISKRLGVTMDTVYNVKAEIKKIMQQMNDVQRKNSGVPPGSPPQTKVPEQPPQEKIIQKLPEIPPPKVPEQKEMTLEELDKLLVENEDEEKPLPSTPSEIPLYLYKPETKSYAVAYTMIIHKANDVKEISQRLNVSPKAVWNVRGEIKRVMIQMREAQGSSQGTARGQGSPKEVKEQIKAVKESQGVHNNFQGSPRNFSGSPKAFQGSRAVKREYL